MPWGGLREGLDGRRGVRSRDCYLGAIGDTMIYPGSVPSLEVKHLLLPLISIDGLPREVQSLGRKKMKESPIPSLGGRGWPYMVANPLQDGPTRQSDIPRRLYLVAPTWQ